VCVCACARARARVCVCVFIKVQVHVQIDISRECIFTFWGQMRAGNVLSVKRLFSVDTLPAPPPLRPQS